jgi:hypothetical protein
MKHLFTLTFLITTFVSFAQETIIHTLDFETQNTANSLYTLTDEVGTPLNEYSDSYNDYFIRTDGSDINGVYNTPQGTYFFAGMDIDGEATNIGSSDIPFDMTISDIDISQSQSLGVRILLAEDDDGSKQDWDSEDYFKIFYIVDGGTKTEAFSVRAAGSGSNLEPKVDTDGDEVGDGTAITETFSEFEFPINATGNSMTLILSFNLDSGDEDIAVDNLRVIDGFSASPVSPSITVSSGLSGFEYIVGSGPSPEKTFTVSGADLTNDIVVTPPTNYEISETPGTGFASDVITLPQSSGSVISTTLYTRLKSGLTAASYVEDLTVTSTGADEKTISLSGTVFPVPSQDLFFSEYAEGSSNNKYLEIYNPTNAEVSLDGYAYPNASNGSDGTYEFWNSFESGATIAAGDVYIIAHGSAEQAILDLADETHNSLSNGNDGYALAKGSEASFIIIDRIGDFGADPGSGWAVAGVSNATFDKTLVRKSTVTQGNPIWSESSGTTEENSEWIVLDKDTWSYLGTHPHSTLSISNVLHLGINIYPNPTTSIITIDGLEGNAKVDVYALTGQRVLQQNTLSSVDVSALGSGIYMLEISQNGKTISTHKLIKK